jgi:hypothetical protein
MVMSWFEQSGFSPQWTGFSYISDHVGLVVDKVEAGEFFLQVPQFSLANYRLPRSPFSLLITIEELFGRKGGDSGLESRDYGRWDVSR